MERGAAYGRLDSEGGGGGLGSGIPFALARAGGAGIAGLIAPGKGLVCQARDSQAPGIEALASRLQQRVRSAGRSWIRYEPGRSLDANLLLEWLRGKGNL